MVRRPLLLLLIATLLVTFVDEPAGPDAYQPVGAARGDSSRVGRVPEAATSAAGAPALVSLAGLPPVAGTMAQSGGSLVFRPAGDGDMTVLPLFRSTGGLDTPRLPSVRLLEVAGGETDPVFLFHLGSAVVETSAPGVLGELVAEPARVDDLGTAWTTATLTLAPARDPVAAAAVMGSLIASPYADSLFAVLGRPARPAGVVGPRGERAARLGEYQASRDSIALSPAFMTSMAQLRHALAHELAHRWLRDHRQSAEALAAVMAPIRDSLRYGFRNQDEQLAESLAFAVHFLDASRRPAAPARATSLLESYERLVPGTRNAATLLLTFPAYDLHPLVRRAWTPKAHD